MSSATPLTAAIFLHLIGYYNQVSLSSRSRMTCRGKCLIKVGGSGTKKKRERAIGHKM